jgi:hypothetical protein
MDSANLYPSDLDTAFSSPLSALSLGRSEGVYVKHIFGGGGGGEHTASLSKIAASLESVSSDSSGHWNLTESLEVIGGAPAPTAHSDDLTPASSSPSSSSIHIEKRKRSASGSGWLSPLHIAAQKGHERIVRVLLQHKIDCNEADSDGLTPLIHATIGGYEAIVTLLLSNGAHIEKVDSKGRLAFHWAVIHKREAVLKILLVYYMGDQRLVDSYDSDGRTPLHTAIDTGFEAGVQLLLQYGANVHYKARKTSVVQYGNK